MERQLRLRRDAEIHAVRSRGRAVADGPLVVRSLRNETDPPQNRYAVVASRKSGGAVQRNRLKRVTREALRALHPELRPGHDVVVIIRGTIKELPSTDLAREVLTRMFRKTGILGPPSVPGNEREE